MITREIDPELSVQERAQQPRGLWETIRTMWYLGLVCFGGSQAHLSILENLFVKQKAWMTSSIFAAISRLSQTIPGAASTHIIFAIAALKGGWAAGFLAVVLFFFPGFVIMTILGMVVATFTDKSSLVLYVEHALGASAVGIYALTVYRICGKLLTTRTAEAIAFGSASASIFVPDVLRATLGEGPTIVWVYPLILGAGGAVTFLQWFFLRKIDVVDGRDDRPDEESGKSEAVEEVGKEAAKEEKEPSTHGLDDDDSLFEMPSISPFELALRIEREEQEEEERARAAGLSPEHSLPSDEEIEKNMLKAFVPLDGRVGYFFLALAALMLLFSSIILLVVTTYSLIKWFSLFNVIGAFVFANPQAMIPFFVSDVVEHAPYKDVDGSISTSDPWSHHRDFERDLIMGFAIIQAMPGPMFNLSPFLGALLAGFPGAILCWLGLVTPGLFLMAGLLPHWRAFRGMKGVQQALLVFFFFFFLFLSPFLSFF